MQFSRIRVLFSAMCCCLAIGSISVAQITTYIDTDWESGDEGWSSVGFTLGSNQGLFPGSNSGSDYWFSTDEGVAGSDFLTSPIYTMNVGDTDLMMTFTHHYNLEEMFDGGVVELNVNGSGFAYLAAPAVTDYDLEIDAFGGNPIGGLEAYTGFVRDYKASTIDFDGLVSSGDTFQIRFHKGEDSSAGDDGWYIDDLSITSNAVPEPGSATVILGAMGVMFCRRRRQ